MGTSDQSGQADQANPCGGGAGPQDSISAAQESIGHPCCTPASEHARRPETGSQSLVQSTCRIARPVRDLPDSNFKMGTNSSQAFAPDGEGPVRTVSLSAFNIDLYPVTNADFAEFVRATGYRTESELFGWSFVFWAHLPPEHFHELVEDTVAAAPWWCKVRGACWNAPEGPRSHVRGRAKHPVVHVSWNDANAYALWAGRSLPTEAQWEYAARGGLEQKLYPWGDELTPGGKHLCNIWQGEFPRLDTAADGFAGTCPVEAFPPNGFGLYSMTGNVWEWCADWFSVSFPGLRDPTGPALGQAKVMKGGSFLCHASYCNRYRVAARTSNTPDSATSNIGFRCAGNPRESQQL